MPDKKKLWRVSIFPPKKEFSKYMYNSPTHNHGPKLGDALGVATGSDQRANGIVQIIRKDKFTLIYNLPSLFCDRFYW